MDKQSFQSVVSARLVIVAFPLEDVFNFLESIDLEHEINHQFFEIINTLYVLKGWIYYPHPSVEL